MKSTTLTRLQECHAVSTPTTTQQEPDLTELLDEVKAVRALLQNLSDGGMPVIRIE